MDPMATLQIGALIFIVKELVAIVISGVKTLRGDEQTPSTSASGCAWSGEPVGRIAAKIVEAHGIIGASEPDGAKKIYSSKSLLAQLVETQSRQQLLLERIETRLERMDMPR